MSTGAVGEAVGYQSEAAFQRAFKSHMGSTPAQWRKAQQAAPAPPLNPDQIGLRSRRRLERNL
jgi:AraC-like DNA-binding protein